MKPDQIRLDEQREWQEEAERLKVLPPERQREVIALVRAPSLDKRVPKADRDRARRRAEALERHLGLRPQKRS